jgi:ubiquinone biosynthesis protein
MSAAPEPATGLHLRDVGRLAHILRVVATHGLAHYAGRLGLRRRAPGAAEEAGTTMSEARRFRRALEALGPTFIKFGQALSVRQDLFPDEAIREFQALQDRVPAFPAVEAHGIIERELGRPVAQLFARFDDAPLAAASIAQVHGAQLADGTEVIVKVQRPGIEETIRADVEILYFLARLLERHVPESRRYGPLALVDEFAETIAHELDFVREGRHTDRFREHFRDEPAVYVPAVYWELSGRRVLTMAHSTGRRMGSDSPAEAAERRRLAETLVRLFLVQIYEHGFFHGDPHPGNLFVLPDGRLCFHDFGIVGELTARAQEDLRELFLAVVARDPEWLADVYLAMGGAPADVDRGAFVRDLAEALEQYYAAAARGASFGTMVGEFLRLAGRHRIRLLRETLLVGKVFMILDSLVHTLDPAFDMVAAFRRHVPGMLARELLPALDRERALAQGYRLWSVMRRAAAELPATLAEFQRRPPPYDAVSRATAERERATDRLGLSLVIAALVIGASLVTAFRIGPHYADLSVPGLIGYGIAAALAIAWAVALRRSGGA